MSYQQPQAQYAPPPQQAPAPTAPKGLAIAALVTGIVAFFVGWVPVLGIIAGIAAVALGIFALIKHQSKGMSITGLILGAIAFLTSIVMTVTFATAGNQIAKSVKELDTAIEEVQPEPAEVEEVAEEPEPEPEPEPEFTVGQQNAIGKAKSYLNYSAFSRSGLIDQLMFEGFEEADATFGVDQIDVDWNEQAKLKAESYLEFSDFSRDGLIDQLEFEGFTTEQATHGVSAVGY